MINLMEMTYREIAQEMTPLIERHLRQEGKKLHKFKLLEREETYLQILALDDEYNLWVLTFTFSTTGNWPVHPLQSSARLKRIRELSDFRANNIEILGMSTIESAKACIDFFQSAKNFEQRKQH